MATVNTTAKAKQALELARTKLLAAAPAAAGESEALRLSRLVHAVVTDGVAADYLTALDALVG